MPFTKEQMREHRRLRVAEGMCTSCLNRPTRVGLKLCERCSIRISKSRDAWRVRQLSEGRCCDCTLPAAPGLKLCAPHAEDSKVTERLARLKAILEGRCPRCRLDKARDGLKTCPGCRLDRVMHHRYGSTLHGRTKDKPSVTST